MLIAENSYSGDQNSASPNSLYDVLQSAGYGQIRKKEPSPRKTKPGKLEKDATDNSETQQRSRLSTAEARREYQRRYYQMHKEKAKEYQRQYNLTHKKKARVGRGKSNMLAAREVIRGTFNTADIMHSPVEKTLKILEKIIRGERMFTMDTQTPSYKRGVLPIEEPSKKIIPAGTVTSISPNPN